MPHHRSRRRRGTGVAGGITRTQQQRGMTMRELTMDEMDVVSGGEDWTTVGGFGSFGGSGGFGSSSGIIDVFGSRIDNSLINSGGIVWAGSSDNGGWLSMDQQTGLYSNDWDGDGTINEADDAPLNPFNNTITVTANHIDRTAAAFADSQLRTDVLLLSIAGYGFGGVIESVMARLGAGFLERWGVAVGVGTVSSFSTQAQEALWSSYYRQAESVLRSGGTVEVIEDREIFPH